MTREQQQSYEGGLNRPALHPPQESASTSAKSNESPQIERKKQGRGKVRFYSDHENKFLQEASQEALRRQKPDEGETTVFLRELFDNVPPTATELEEIQQRKEKRARRAAQYKLRQVRKKQPRDGAQLPPRPS